MTPADRLFAQSPSNRTTAIVTGDANPPDDFSDADAMEHKRLDPIRLKGALLRVEQEIDRALGRLKRQGSIKHLFVNAARERAPARAILKPPG